MPADACGNATINLFSGNDECSMSVQALFDDNTTVLMNLYNGDCPTRFHAYVTACSGIFGNDADEVSG